MQSLSSTYKLKMFPQSLEAIWSLDFDRSLKRCKAVWLYKSLMKRMNIMKDGAFKSQAALKSSWGLQRNTKLVRESTGRSDNKDILSVKANAT